MAITTDSRLGWAPISEVDPDLCADKAPDWRELMPDHWVACHFAGRPNFSPN